ncbi:MAG: hypothetical protein V2A73_18105 [Pseudomonadota bacterium]
MALLPLLAPMLLVLLPCDQAQAVVTRVFSTASYQSFDEGETENAMITSQGEVVSGYAADRIALDTDAIWTATQGADGTIYAGAVTNGTIYAISEGKKRVLVSFSQDTPWIGSLALGPDGVLYAGTVGTATVHQIDLKTGKAKAIVTLDGAEHVWTLVFDGKTLFAATGPECKLFAIDIATAKAKELWACEDKHLLSATLAKDGAIWLGTADEAILYRFDPRTGTARSINDFAGTEIKAIVEASAGVFVVAVNEFERKDASPPSPSGTKKPKGTEAKPPASGTSPGAAKQDKTGGVARTGERKGKGAVFSVDLDGRVEQLHALPDGYFQALATTPDGELFAGASPGGRVYRLGLDRTVATAFDVDERQVNAILTSSAKGIAFATGDIAAVYTATRPATNASYTSKALDAQFPARWGNIRWQGEGRLLVETRSGNTAAPDRAWSAWQPVASPSPTTGGATIGRIVSPTARYFQWRVSLSGQRDLLREVRAYYLPHNQRPRITEVVVGEGSSPATALTTNPGPTKPRSPILKLKWKTENSDSDALHYLLEYREENETSWQRLPTGTEPLTKTEFDWNTEPIPDGYYRLRVTASDAPANPPDLVLEGQRISEPFLIDNQKPQLVGLTAHPPFASGQATDSFSRIEEIAYSIDSDNNWVTVFPLDGIFDALSEPFSFKLPPDLAPGTHTLSVRIADGMGNIGAATVTFQTGRQTGQ